MDIKYSVLISSYNRIKLLKRTLFSIARQVYSNDDLHGNLEVVLADDGSTDDIVSELHYFNSAFAWKFIKVNLNKFTEKTGLTKFHNNPSLTNNIAFLNSSGDKVFLMGNEIIAHTDAFKIMLKESEQLGCFYLVLSNTYDVPEDIVNNIDDYGANFSPSILTYCKSWPLADKISYHTDVTNYLSLTSRATWLAVGGYDERYVGGIACEDSDFVRRSRLLPDFKLVRSDAISLHQFHGGKTHFYEPVESVITKERWAEGLDKNRKIYNNWDEKTSTVKLDWDWGTVGIEDIITQGY